MMPAGLFTDSVDRRPLPGGAGRCALALLLVAVLEFGISAYSMAVHWQTARRRADAMAATGEGLVIHSDGLGYYAWLRSLLCDGDWSFDNEFDEHNPSGNSVPPVDRRTPLGRRCNQWSVGPACAWSLLIVPVHWLASASAAPWPADGYSLPYQLAIAAATWLASVLGLVLLYHACRSFAPRQDAALAAVWTTLGTTIVYYNAIEPSMAHGLGTVAVAALVAYWLRTYGSRQPMRWFLVGVLVGLAALMRWQLATMVILPGAEAFLQLLRITRPMQPATTGSPLPCGGEGLGVRGTGNHDSPTSHPRLLSPTGEMGGAEPPPSTLNIGNVAVFPLAGQSSEPPRRWPVLFRSILNLVLAGAGAVAAFAPQMVAWKCVYGSWLTSPLPVSPHWGAPAWRDLIISQDRSLFYWTPLALILLVAALAAAVSPRAMKPGSGRHWPAGRLRILLLAFLCHAYVVAALWGRPGVYLGASFGMRHLNESLVLLAPGLAAFLGRLSDSSRRWWLGAGWLLVAWNLLLVCQYRYGFVPAEAGAALSELVGNARWLMKHRPWLAFTHVVIGPLVAGWLLAGPWGVWKGLKTTCQFRGNRRGNCRQSSSPAAAT